MNYFEIMAQTLLEERQRVHLDGELISQCVCLILYEHAHTSVFMYMSGHK